MNNLGIRHRVLILALLPLVLATGVLAWYFMHSRHTELDRALEERALTMAMQLAKSCEFALFSGHLDELDRLARPLYRQGDVRVVRIADARGRDLLSLGAPRLAPRWHDGGPVLEAGDQGAIMVMAPVRQQTLALDDSFVEQGDSLLGFVALEVSRQTTRERQRRMLIMGMLIAGAGVLLAGALAWRLGRDIVEPIGQLTDALGRIGDGDLNVRVRVDTGGEFALLAQGVNQMTAELKQSYESLQEKVRAATAKLTWQASHDALTGLPNRTGFEDALQCAWREARRDGHRHCLLYLDLDRFKVVNDTSGHQAGDELLRQLSTRMRHVLRASDVVARLGGDEFGILLTHCEVATGEALGEKLRQSIDAFRFAWQGRVYQVGASIGLVEIDAHWPDTAGILAAADAACYAAKDAGRNKVRLYRHGDEDVSRRRGEMEWVNRLTRAMDEGHLQLHFQPIVALNRVDDEPHYELLLRLRDDLNGGLILPMAFIPAAERYQLMPRIDRWVLDHALARCADGVAPADIVIGINLSGASLSDTGFQSYIRERMRAHPDAATRICLEITETAAISNLDSVRELIADLKSLGCRFALDDFGSGLSSFGYLHSLQVDYLKIDGAFVQDMARDPVDAAMVEAIVKVARIMGLRTVAEFVEDAETAEALRQLGVDFAQGNHFALPAPLDVLCDRLGRPAKG